MIHACDVTLAYQAVHGFTPDAADALKILTLAEGENKTELSTVIGLRKFVQGKPARESEVRAAFAAWVTYRPSSAQVSEWHDKPLGELVAALKTDPNAR